MLHPQTLPAAAPVQHASRDGLRALPDILACLAVVGLGVQLAFPTAVAVGPFTVDRATCALVALIAGAGSMVFRAAARALEGMPGRDGFLTALTVTVLASAAAAAADDLVVLAGASVVASVGLQRLLATTGRDKAMREAAQAVLRRKFLVDRIGDAALLAAVAIAWFGAGTTSLRALAPALEEPGLAGAGLSIALLVAVAALARSAQFPFHAWLPETVGSPTPVSALMHAGLVNAGGILLVRFAPVLLGAPWVLVLVAAAGSITIARGVIGLRAEPTAKRRLAFSTMAQMGFMTAQCGMGAFGAALLHIVAHGATKAHWFLRAGELPAAEAPRRTSDARGRAAAIVAGVALGAAFLLLAVPMLAPALLGSPGEMALLAVVALASGPIWRRRLVAARGGIVRRTIGATAVVAGLALLATLAAAGAHAFLEPVVAATVPAASGISPPIAIASLLPVATVAMLGLLPPARSATVDATAATGDSAARTVERRLAATLDAIAITDRLAPRVTRAVARGLDQLLPPFASYPIATLLGEADVVLLRRSRAALPEQACGDDAAHPGLVPPDSPALPASRIRGGQPLPWLLRGSDRRSGSHDRGRLGSAGPALGRLRPSAMAGGRLRPGRAFRRRATDGA